MLGVLNVKPCGVTYRLITLSQIPIAIGFTSFILYDKKKEQELANREYADKTAAATSSFMALFLASMSMVQYILLGMTRINEAVMYALLCFVASIIGLVTMQKVISKSGRVSLVAFLVCGLMALSTVVITLFGALHVWNQIANGDYVGFKKLC